MAERSREEELPISSKPNSPVPEIFSSKKIFFLNSSHSGSRRSEIPNIESDYCPRDEVSRRLFPRSSDSCDCDCVSDGCWGCLRRNKQTIFKFFVLALSIALILLLFGSLSYNLTRSKALDESLELDKSEWISHYHEYSASEEKKLSHGSTSLDADPILDLPAPIYESSDDYESGEDSPKLPYHKDPTPDFDKVEPISFFPFSQPTGNAHNGTLIIYDVREPSRIRRSPPSWTAPLKTELLKTQSEAHEESIQPERETKPLLTGLRAGANKFWENYFRRGKVFFELAIPRPSTSEAKVHSKEEETEGRFSRTPAVFHAMTKAKSSSGKGTKSGAQGKETRKSSFRGEKEGTGTEPGDSEERQVDRSAATRDSKMRTAVAPKRTTDSRAGESGSLQKNSQARERELRTPFHPSGSFAPGQGNKVSTKL